MEAKKVPLPILLTAILLVVGPMVLGSTQERYQRRTHGVQQPESIIRNKNITDPTDSGVKNVSKAANETQKLDVTNSTRKTPGTGEESVNLYFVEHPILLAPVSFVGAGAITSTSVTVPTGAMDPLEAADERIAIIAPCFGMCMRQTFDGRCIRDEQCLRRTNII